MPKRKRSLTWVTRRFRSSTSSIRDKYLRFTAKEGVYCGRFFGNVETETKRFPLRMDINPGWQRPGAMKPNLTRQIVDGRICSTGQKTDWLDHFYPSSFAVALYAWLRPRYTPTRNSAVLSGIAIWLIFWVIPTMALMPFEPLPQSSPAGDYRNRSC
jgi:hypothetical protein